MIGALDPETGLQHLTDHRRQQTVVASQLDTFGGCSLDELLGPLAHRRRIAGHEWHATRRRNP